MASAFIRDGYTETGYVKEFEGIHPACRFKYRPMTIEQRSELLDKMGKSKNSTRADQWQAGSLAAHLVGWDLEHNGNPVAISATSILSLKFNLFNRLSGIVLLGVMVSDVDPDLVQGDSADDELELQALLADKPVNDARAENLEKNSEAA